LVRITGKLRLARQKVVAGETLARFAFAIDETKIGGGLAAKFAVALQKIANGR